MGCISPERRFCAGAQVLLLESIAVALPFERGPSMTFPVTVHPSNGQFEAALVGAPDVRATGRSSIDLIFTRGLFREVASC
jgi:hypothetical protein